MKNPDPELDDPFYEDGPTSETLLEAMRQMSVDEIAGYYEFRAAEDVHSREAASPAT